MVVKRTFYTLEKMEARRQHRRFIKNKPQNLWRENFKKKCLEQFRRSRDTQVNQRRFGLNVICEEEVCHTLNNLYFYVQK